MARMLKPERLGSNYLTALAQSGDSVKVDSRTGEPFDPEEDVAIVNEYQVDGVLVRPDLRVNRFQLMPRLSQYYVMDFYSRVLDARIDCVRHLSARIMMGQARAKRSALEAQEEERRKRRGRIHAGVFVDPILYGIPARRYQDECVCRA